MSPFCLFFPLFFPPFSSPLFFPSLLFFPSPLLFSFLLISSPLFFPSHLLDSPLSPFCVFGRVYLNWIPPIFSFSFSNLAGEQKLNEGRGRARGHCAHASMRPAYRRQTHVFVYPHHESSGCVTIPASQADSLRCMQGDAFHRVCRSGSLADAIVLIKSNPLLVQKRDQVRARPHAERERMGARGIKIIWERKRAREPSTYTHTFTPDASVPSPRCLLQPPTLCLEDRQVRPC